MDATADELAGVVDLFGGLTRAELERALAEAAYRDDGRSVEAAALETAIEAALESFALVRYEPDGGERGPDGEALLVAGPAAFPTVPAYAEDVPHILEIDRRRFDREALGAAARERLRETVDAATDAADTERIRTLIDITYDLEAWAPIDCTDERRQLEAQLEE